MDMVNLGIIGLGNWGNKLANIVAKNSRSKFNFMLCQN